MDREDREIGQNAVLWMTYLQAGCGTYRQRGRVECISLNDLFVGWVWIVQRNRTECGSLDDLFGGCVWITRTER